jgi:N utilization substance protein B
VSTSPGPEGSWRREQPGARRRARERALELLYEAETKGLTSTELLAELPVEPDEYAAELVLGVERRAEELNGLLARHATGWAVERMPMVDRCVLKMAAFELLEEPEVPVAVVLDEAVELAKTFSTEDSGRYVNGVLSAVANEVRGRGREDPGA